MKTYTLEEIQTSTLVKSEHPKEMSLKMNYALTCWDKQLELLGKKEI